MKKIIYILFFSFFSRQLNAQVPLLSSLNSAAPVIFLDFDGHTVKNTAWNYNGPIICNAAGLNTTQIIEIFNRVAEDFRSFTVNVTTDSTKYIAAPINKRMRVVITTSYEWYGSSGGVSYIGSFSWGDDTPCFVFSSLLGNNIKMIAEAASHETGHTLGLYHQSSYNSSCVKTSDYNYGTGSGETGWAPIMGVGYYQNLTTWHNGPNSFGCDSIQNDRTVITNAINGITIRADDNANTIALAPALIISNNSFTASGNFEQTNDEDLFKIQVTTLSRLKVAAKPLNVGSLNAGANSDILLQFFNSSMNMIKTSNPLDSLHAAIDTILNSGTYYVRLKPVSNTYANTYGMAGNYTIAGTLIPSSTLPLRKLELTGKNVGDKHLLQWLIDADEQITEASIEYSTDGTSFTTLSRFKEASGFYSYTPSQGHSIIYRIKVLFDNGKTYYSKTVIITNTQSNDEPQVMTNPVTNGTILIAGGATYQYLLFDSQGRQLKTGTLNGDVTNIPFQATSNGLYIMKFIKNDGHTCVRKIMIQ